MSGHITAASQQWHFCINRVPSAATSSWTGAAAAPASARWVAAAAGEAVAAWAMVPTGTAAAANAVQTVPQGC